MANDVSNRFNNNLMYGSFKGKRKISAFVLNGNTGQDGLNWQDRQKYGGNDDNNFEMMDEDGIFSYQISNNSAFDDIIINTENGFIRNINAGIQYSNKLNDNHNFNFSPKYNLQDYTNEKTINNITQIGDSALYKNDSVNTQINRYNMKSSIVYDYKLDNNNSLKMTVKANYYNTDSKERSKSNTTNNSEALINRSVRDNEIQNTKNDFSGNLLLKHKFQKNRRTLSLNTDFNTTKASGNNFLISKNDIYVVNNPFSINIDQLTKSEKSTEKISSKLTYTEPLNKKWAMEMSYEFSINNGINQQNTYQQSSTANVYDHLIDSLSNSFDQSIVIQTPSAKFNYAFKKFKFNAGSGFGITTFDLLDNTSNKSYNRNYTNIFPNATFVYNYKSNHALRIKYNGYQNQPTLNQLQPLRNNNDIFNQYIGNPDLKPSFSNNISFVHNGYSFLKNIWNYQSLNITVNKNAITNNRVINPLTGATSSTYINTNGNYNVNLWAGSGFKLKKSNIDIQINTNVNVSRFADVINNNVSFAKNYSGGLSFNASKSKKEKYDISVNNDFNYNLNKNAQTTNFNRFANNTASLNCTFYYFVFPIGFFYFFCFN
jgi:hypothetical protein